MLLFIPTVSARELHDQHFKTSHVIVYRLLQVRSEAVQGYFKTSHVIVYLKLLPDGIAISVFQNISCYCLSDPELAAEKTKD